MDPQVAPETIRPQSSAAIQPDGPLITPAKIMSAVERIVHLASPARVVAFGSRGRGTHRAESDLDLAVIVDRYDPKSGRRPVWRADIDVWMDMDIVVYDLAREQMLIDSPLSLQSLVCREGVVLYDRETGLIDRSAVARLI